MSNYELICELRDAAGVEGPGTLRDLLKTAADTIEATDERMDIVYADMLHRRSILVRPDGTIEVTVYYPPEALPHERMEP